MPWREGGNVEGDRVSGRLLGRVRRDFPDGDVARAIVYALRKLAVDLESSRQDTERLLAAAVFAAAGDVSLFYLLIRQDWRDLLMDGGLGGPDWPQVLDAELGPR